MRCPSPGRGTGPRGSEREYVRRALRPSSISARLVRRRLFLELADEPGEEDVATVQIEWVLKDEALERNSFARFARASLVRTIYEQLPQGWGIGEKADFRRAGVYADWRGTLGPEYNDATDRVFDALEAANPPRGWLPAGADDPIIDKASWKASSTIPWKVRPRTSGARARKIPGPVVPYWGK